VTQYTQTHFRLDGIFLGLLLSYIYNFNPEKLEFIIKHRVILVSASTLFLISEFILERQDHLWEAVVMPAVNPLVFAVFIISALNTNKLKSNFIGYIGQQSYGIYLWHFIFVYYMGYFVTKTKMSVNTYSDIIYGMSFKTFFILYLITYFVLSIATGILFTKLIETRVLKIRDKLYPSRANNIISEKA
ncbi:MAG: lipopolysaccharide modification acyltransferase, partial [Mucilaginibacter sp.]|nr:lipopolysaccharide modification acyltransferase [Mucilaginibacter sp.]